LPSDGSGIRKSRYSASPSSLCKGGFIHLFIRHPFCGATPRLCPQAGYRVGHPPQAAFVTQTLCSQGAWYAIGVRGFIPCELARRYLCAMLAPSPPWAMRQRACGYGGVRAADGGVSRTMHGIGLLLFYVGNTALQGGLWGFGGVFLPICLLFASKGDLNAMGTGIRIGSLKVWV